MSNLVTQPSFRAVGQTHAEWQTFEKLKNKRQMYGSQAWMHKVYDRRSFSVPVSRKLEIVLKRMKCADIC